MVHGGSCLQSTSAKKSLSAFSRSRRHQIRIVFYYSTTYRTQFQCIFMPPPVKCSFKRIASRCVIKAPSTRSRFHGETAKVLYGSALRPHEAGESADRNRKLLKPSSEVVSNLSGFVLVSCGRLKPTETANHDVIAPPLDLLANGPRSLRNPNKIPTFCSISYPLLGC